MLRTKSSILVRAGNVADIGSAAVRLHPQKFLEINDGIQDRDHLRYTRSVEAGGGAASHGRGPHYPWWRHRSPARHRGPPEYAPVTAIRGNIDKGDWADDADTELVRLAARSIFVVHDLKVLRIDPVASGIDVIVSGHTHVPKIDTVDGVLYLNKSRKRGARRFKLPITLATLDITSHGMQPVIHDLVDGRLG
jgi:hypothetical protein